MRLLDETVYNTHELETQQADLTERIEETLTLMNQLIASAAATAHDPDDYDLPLPSTRSPAQRAGEPIPAHH